jgi:hypothetical protein
MAWPKVFSAGAAAELPPNQLGNHEGPLAFPGAAAAAELAAVLVEGWLGVSPRLTE